VKDADSIEKYKFVKKTLKERAFKEAICASEKYETEIDINNITVEESYKGPVILTDKPLTSEW
jgi:hypothetical protein